MRAALTADQMAALIELDDRMADTSFDELIGELDTSLRATRWATPLYAIGMDDAATVVGAAIVTFQMHEWGEQSAAAAAEYRGMMQFFTNEWRKSHAGRLREWLGMPA